MLVSTSIMSCTRSSFTSSYSPSRCRQRRFDVLRPESRQAIPVFHHDDATGGRTKNRKKTFTVPVEAAAHLGHHLRHPQVVLCRERCQPSHLPVQVRLLVGGRNASVQHRSSALPFWLVHQDRAGGHLAGGYRQLPGLPPLPAVWYAMPFIRAQSESFIKILYHNSG